MPSPRQPHTATMYLIPKDSMASKLDPAWAFLSGQQRHFEEGLLHDIQPGERTHAILLPVYQPQTQATRLMAVSLLIDDQEATAMARFMFGLGQNEIQANDVHDACMEACNVLGGCLVMSDRHNHTVEIGLPQTLPMGRFSELQRQASEHVTFTSHDASGQNVVVTVFDAVEQSLLEPRDDGHA